MGKSIDYTLIAYKSALEDWQSEATTKNHTMDGFCHYFHFRHCIDYDAESFPELYAWGLAEGNGELFLQFRPSGMFPAGRQKRITALFKSIEDRELKSNFEVTLKNHTLTRSIRELGDLERVLKYEKSIYVVEWGKLMSCKFFTGSHWTDEAKKKYLKSRSFWLAKRINK